MNYGWCSSFRKDSFHLKQDQALGLWDVLQIPDTTDQFSPIVENQLDVGGNHHLFYHLHAIDEVLTEEIKNARLVANPGCYPTSVQLPLVPFIKASLIELKNIIIDAKSGVSGAGRSAKENLLFTEDEEFVVMLENGAIPQTHSVKRTNYGLINVFLDQIPGRAIIISVIDNLVKGASGQALQNLNLLMGFPKNLGLHYLPLFP
ncbi:putative N-acetyl-gamma-glutamyl-phosphate reductase, chloroplastic [Glycine soja]|uniref:Putative N-acetyl-gamma-glutamyl-phosphate reductase, chloroplastic n=1 Tax=Glycine soja TaxID=3848 RepID=A0A445GVM6_GLYSO|nr:putative N-acetyl-gamma-glutamyl-phosphate reductase, chloroplastic [Glycine soja]